MPNIRKTLKEINSKTLSTPGPIPIWLLNGDLENSRLLRQINQMHEQGVEKFALKAEVGINPGYRTAEFLEYLRFILREAKNLGMKVILGDDLQYSHPGVHSALTAQNPNFRMEYLSVHEVIKAKGPKKIEASFESENVNYAFALKVKDSLLDFSSAKNVTPNLKENTLKWSAPVGDWRIFVFKIQYNKKPIGSYQFNCFSQEATKAYIEAAFGELKQPLKGFFGTTLSGFLVELPNITPDTSIRGLPWSPDLNSQMKGLCSVDTMTLILALFINNYSRKNGHIRRSYYKLLQKVLGQNCVKPLLEFGARQKIDMHLFLNSGDLFTGDGMLRLDYSPLLEKYSIEGLSNNASLTVGNSIYTRCFADFKDLHSPSRGSAILGRNRNGIGHSIKDLKLESDLLSLAGTHECFIDGNYYDLKYRSGLRVPANTFTYSEFFGQYHLLLKHIKRKRHLLGKLMHGEEVGVLFPGESLCSAYNPANLAVYRSRIKQFETLVGKLTAGAVGFNFINETMLAHLDISPKGEALQRAGRTIKQTFRTLIIPEASVLPKRAVAVLEKFAKNGGTIVFYGITATESLEQGKDPNLLKKLDAMQGKIAGRIFKLTMPQELESLPKICHENSEKPVELFTESEVEKRLLYRAFTDGQQNFYLIVNPSPTESIRSEVKINDFGYLHYLDIAKGVASALPEGDQTNEIQPFIYNFSPSEACVFFAADGRIAPVATPIIPVEDASRIYRIILKDEWEFEPLDDNALPMNSFSMRINSNREVNTGFNLAYESYVTVEQIPTRCHILLNNLINAPVNGHHSGKYPVEVSFNGVNLKEMKFYGRGEPPFQANEVVSHINYGGLSAYAADVSAHVRRGLNRITIKTFGSSFHPLQVEYPLVFLGNFALKRGQQGWIVGAQQEVFNYGSWTEQGFPFFCGRGVYRQVFEKPGDFKKIFLRFKNFESKLTVRLNGKELEVLPWQPAVADLSPYMQDGKNKIEIEVSNIHNNLLKMGQLSAGLTAEAYLDVYQ